MPALHSVAGPPVALPDDPFPNNPTTPTPDNILEELIKDNVLRQRLTQLAAAAPATDGTDGTQQAGAAAASPSAPSPSSAPGVPSDEGLFSDYASGIVNTVMHFFKVKGRRRVTKF